MIFKVTMKDTDVLYDAIDEAIDEELVSIGLDEDEREVVKDVRGEKYRDIAGQWFEYGEYLTVEIDTEKETIRVVPKGESE